MAFRVSDFFEPHLVMLQCMAICVAMGSLCTAALAAGELSVAGGIQKCFKVPRRGRGSYILISRAIVRPADQTWLVIRDRYHSITHCQSLKLDHAPTQSRRLSQSWFCWLTPMSSKNYIWASRVIPKRGHRQPATATAAAWFSAASCW